MSSKSFRRHTQKYTPKRPQGIGNPKNWAVYEGENPYKQMRKGMVKLGDTITMHTNNQMGNLKYEVIMNKKGKKDLKVIDSYDKQMARLDEESPNSTPRTMGGKNRTKRKSVRM